VASLLALDRATTKPVAAGRVEEREQDAIDSSAWALEYGVTVFAVGPIGLYENAHRARKV
jgi:hypothetical protein